jgi:phenylalanyl-tRNA synthetase alpha subunit
MKRYVSTLLALITIFAVLAVSACAKPPTAEMENAAVAVTRAENEPNILDYAENTLKQAQNSLARMNEAANNKKFDEAKLLAQEASNLAERAISEARAGAEKAASDAITISQRDGADAENLINSVKSSISEAEQALKNAQTVRNIELNTNAIAYEINAAKDLIEDAENSLASKNYNEAENSAVDARSAVSSAMSLIAEAARESSRKK